ncbi:MAG TPA: MurR/RpiR family transcriptional regulator [Solirubrobacteraceae bacterium]|nr:MurR/RpiR family transcriptional regulator [Solirubrobacteraceae bacterium]
MPHGRSPAADAADLYRLVRQASLTPAERRVADVVLADYPQSALLSAQEVAAKARVSASSVSRFTAKVGYETFGELRDHLREHLRARLESPGGRLRMGAARTPTASDALAEAVEIDIDNLRRTLELVNGEVFDQLVLRLSRPEGRVYVAASKKARILAEYLAIPLNQIRRSVVTLRMDDALPDRLLDMTARDVLLALEPRRATRMLVRLIDQFKQAGATVGVITDESMPAVLARVDYPIPVPIRSASAFDSYTAYMSIINAILAALIARAPARAKSRIDRLEQLNLAFSTWYEAEDD